MLEPRMRLGKLDTEAEPAIAARYGIQGIPSLILIASGKEVDRISGAMPTSSIVQWADQALARRFPLAPDPVIAAQTVQPRSPAIA